MKYRVFACAALQAAAMLSWANASRADIGIYSSLDSMSYSEPLPIHQIADDWQGKLEDGNLAFTYNRFEVGVSWNNWRIGYVARYDYRLEFSEDTALFYYEEENNVRRSRNRVYDVYLDVVHQRSQGMAIHYDWQVQDNLRITPSLAYLHANDIIDGTLKGQAEFYGDNTFSGNLGIDYYYLEDFLFERPVDTGKYRGHGYSFDLDIQWQPLDHWQIQLKTYDLLARIHWDGLPRTRARADTEPVQTDDPFERYRDASVQGRETDANFHQKLPTRALLRSAYQYKSLHLAAEIYQEPDQTFVFPSIGYEIGGWTFTLLGEPFIEAAGARITHRWLSFSFVADRLDFKEAKYVNLNLALNVPLF